MIILKYLTIPCPPYSVLRISRFVKTRPAVLRSKPHLSLCRPFSLAVTNFYGGREGSTRAISTILDLPNKSPDCTEYPDPLCSGKQEHYPPAVPNLGLFTGAVFLAFVSYRMFSVPSTEHVKYRCSARRTPYFAQC